VRLGGSYLVLVVAALLAGSALRVPAGPVLVMAVLMAGHALVAAALLRRPPGAGLSGRRSSRCP
jgi:hypothetical protein